MELLDDDGNLLGVVNVIDALAVLLVIAVLLAGAAFLGFIGEQPAEQTRYVTIDLGEHPDYVAEQIEEGDVMARASTDGNLTVTDVYVTPSGNESVEVTIRAEVEGVVVESDQRTGTVFQYDDEVIRPGTELVVDTLDYELEGTVVSIASDGPTLDTEERTVTVRTGLPTTTARELSEGDTYELAGHTIAEIESVTLHPIGKPVHRRAIIELRLQTIRRDGGLLFGSEPVQLGSSIPFETDSYALSGTVISRDALSSVSETKTITVVVKYENVSPEQANVPEVGMTEQVDEGTTARVTDKRVEPAIRILTSDDGDIYKREHPRNKDVYLTIELEVRDTADGLYFHGQRLQHGDVVALDFRTITLRGQVVDIDQ